MDRKSWHDPKPTASDLEETARDNWEAVRVELAAALECCRGRAVLPMLTAIDKSKKLSMQLIH